MARRGSLDRTTVSIILFFLFLKGGKHLCDGSACGSVLLVRGQLQIVFHKLINFQKIVLNEFMS